MHTSTGLWLQQRACTGNLERAVRITETYYELQLRPDLYTGRHCQWFYFQIQNMRTDVRYWNCASNSRGLMFTDTLRRYRLSIVNFTKPDSLYTCGMKPVLYSKTEADRHFVGWTRVGDNIRWEDAYKIAYSDNQKPSLFVAILSLTTVSGVQILP